MAEEIKIDRTQQINSAILFLSQTADRLTDGVLKQFCKRTLESPEFRTCTAARKQHQAFRGGLVVHTAEVLEIALAIASTKCLQIDLNVLIPATILHDIGKMYDYVEKEDGTFEYTEHQKYVRHLSRSYAEFMKETDHLVPEEL